MDAALTRSIWGITSVLINNDTKISPLSSDTNGGGCVTPDVTARFSVLPINYVERFIQRSSILCQCPRFYRYYVDFTHNFLPLAVLVYVHKA